MQTFLHKKVCDLKLNKGIDKKGRKEMPEIFPKLLIESEVGEWSKNFINSSLFT